MDAGRALGVKKQLSLLRLAGKKSPIDLRGTISMKLKLSGAVLAAAVLVSASLPTAARAEDLGFVLRNKTSATVTGLYVTHNRSKRWGENLIAKRDRLRPGEVGDVTISDGRRDCDYDIRVEFGDGDSTEDYDIDLCELGEYTVHE